MSSLHELFETNSSYEKDGIWFEISSSRFKIARAGGSNKKYSQILSNLFKPYQRQYENGTLDEEKASEIMDLAFIRGCLLGWEGVTSRDGQPIEFSEGAALKLLGELPDLADLLRSEAGKISNYRKEVIEDASRKSEAT